MEIHANVFEDADTIALPGPPYSYLGVAQGLLPGVRVLADERTTGGMPLALLAGHVLECLSKAFLYRALGSDGSLTTEPKLRHNLSALWSLAKQHGLPLADPAPSWVDCLNHSHDQPFHLRYAKSVHAIVTPASEPMASELHALVDTVRRAIK